MTASVFSGCTVQTNDTPKAKSPATRSNLPRKQASRNVRRTIDDLTARYLTGEHQRDVYLVSHGAAIRLIAAHLTKLDPEFAMKNYLQNTGTVDLEYSDGLWICHRWGEAALPGMESPTDDAAQENADPMG